MWPPGGRFSRRWCFGWSAGCGLEVEDLLGVGDAELGEQVSLGLGEAGDLLERAGGAGEGPGVEALELEAGLEPGRVGLGLDDADEEEGEPAEDAVGADAFFEPVVVGPQVDDLYSCHASRARLPGASRDTRESAIDSCLDMPREQCHLPRPRHGSLVDAPSVLKFSQSRPTSGHLVHVLPTHQDPRGLLQNDSGPHLTPRMPEYAAWAADRNADTCSSDSTRIRPQGFV